MWSFLPPGHFFLEQPLPNWRYCGKMRIALNVVKNCLLQKSLHMGQCLNAYTKVSFLSFLSRQGDTKAFLLFHLSFTVKYYWHIGSPTGSRMFLKVVCWQMHKSIKCHLYQVYHFIKNKDWIIVIPKQRS